ncbi:MAG: glycosyltransferase family 25 protein [Sandarakinorhabdus sp.]|nr:glycosyltransferase family 25 protein [Sandarakinorhabdus sp.]
MIKVRVISLADSPRRAGMAAQLAAIPGIDWSFFDACTDMPAILVHDSAAATATIRRDLTRGELGCFASHASLWHELAAAPEGSVMIVLEDDLLIDPGFFGALASFEAQTRGIDYLRLHAKVPAPARVVGRVAGRHLVRYQGIAFGTQGYFIRKAAARRFATAITRVVRPVDDEMDRYWANGVPNMGVFPFPLLELAGPSTIEAERRGRARPGALDIGYQARRLAESLRRRLANLRLALGLPL